MSTDEEENDLLEQLAQGKAIDYEKWPALSTRLISRLEKITHTEFTSTNPALTLLPSSQPLPSSPPHQPSSTASSSQDPSTQSTDKENAPPREPASYLQSLLDSITSTLTSLFSKHPPHTIQRLAELVLRPRDHYTTLPTYLHAVDRVVHVSSGAHIFPLPPAIPDPSSSAVLSNGGAIDPLSISWANSASAQLGSDESLGGALLTPITWLTSKSSNGNTHSPLEGEVKTESKEMIEGPNGMGGVETVSVSVNGVSSTRSENLASASVAAAADDEAARLRAEGGVTQGELLRQEQRAGVIPATQLKGELDGLAEEDETPHARGPDEIGMEDMGPQSAASEAERSGPGVRLVGIDVEAAVGRKAHPSDDVKVDKPDLEVPPSPKREAEEQLSALPKRVKEADQGVELVDADGKTEDEKKVGEEGENKGADAADSTTL